MADCFCTGFKQRRLQRFRRIDIGHKIENRCSELTELEWKEHGSLYELFIIIYTVCWVARLCGGRLYHRLPDFFQGKQIQVETIGDTKYSVTEGVFGSLSVSYKRVDFCIAELVVTVFFGRLLTWSWADALPVICESHGLAKRRIIVPKLSVSLFVKLPLRGVVCLSVSWFVSVCLWVGLSPKKRWSSI